LAVFLYLSGALSVYFCRHVSQRIGNGCFNVARDPADALKIGKLASV